MANRERKIALIGSLLLTLFLWYWSSVTLFSHEHFVEGERVMHSHPFAGSSHNHTSSQMQAISFLAMFLALAATTGVALCKSYGFKSEITTNLTEQVTIAPHATHSLRAPPATLL
ncbi:MAG: hypothetical protein J6Q20_04910 [Alistipes sp.]|nr:hypothetical protein [Alistipes sp.]